MSAECDMRYCGRNSVGEIRKLPIGSARIRVCRHCFSHEMEYRADMAYRTGEHTNPAYQNIRWEDLPLADPK